MPTITERTARPTSKTVRDIMSAVSQPKSAPADLAEAMEMMDEPTTSAMQEAFVPQHLINKAVQMMRPVGHMISLAEVCASLMHSEQISREYALQIIATTCARKNVKFRIGEDFKSIQFIGRDASGIYTAFDPMAMSAMPDMMYWLRASISAEVNNLVNSEVTDEMVQVMSRSALKSFTMLKDFNKECGRRFDACFDAINDLGLSHSSESDMLVRASEMELRDAEAAYEQHLRAIDDLLFDC
jgi:hypothetical protein